MLCLPWLPEHVRAVSPQRYVRARKARHTHVPRADAYAPFGFGFAESPLRKLRFLRRISPQSEDCVRARPFRVADLFASVRSARPLAVTSLRSCARLLRNLRGFPPKASLSSAHFRVSSCGGSRGPALPNLEGDTVARRIRSGPVAGTPPSLPAKGRPSDCRGVLPHALQCAIQVLRSSKAHP